jgi:hypothetical protein
MCEVAGILLMAIILLTGIRTAWRNEALAAVFWIAFSPMFVDFSSNGSFYILSTTLIILHTALLDRFRYEMITDYVLAGILCAIGLQIHATLMCLPLSLMLFWLWERSRLRWKGVCAFIMTAVLVLTPWMSWRLFHFGSPFYSSNKYAALGVLGLAKEGIYDNIITTRITAPFDVTLLKRYITIMVRNISVFSYHYLREIGPFCLILALLGCFRLFKTDIRRGLAFFLPVVLYTMIVFLFPGGFRSRFLVPALPLAYIAAGWGLIQLFTKGSLRWKLVGSICMLGVVVWNITGFFEKPPTRYFYNDAAFAAGYLRAYELATEMESLEPGVILGYSSHGDFDAVYWHRFPFVWGHRFKKAEEIRKLVHDFGIRYVWADDTTMDRVQSFLPEARIILRHEPYAILEIIMPTQSKLVSK